MSERSRLQRRPAKNSDSAGVRNGATLLMKKMIACLCILGCGTALAVDLEQAYQDALANDPVLAGAIAGNKISRENLWSGISVLLPSVNASINRGRSDFERGRGGGDLPFVLAEGESENKGWSVSLNQAIFDAGAIFQFLAIRDQIKAADWNLISTEQALVLRVAQAYLAVLQAQDNLESSLAAEEAVQRQLEQVQQRFDVGLVAITDVLDATASYDLAVVDRLSARSNHGIFFESLRTVTGVNYQELGKLKDDLPIESPEPADEEEWVRAAMTGNPQIQVAKAQWDASKNSRSASLSYLVPSIRLSASKRYSEDPLSVFTDQSTTTGFSISASVPLFTGGRNISQARTSAWRTEQAKQNYIQSQLTVARDTRNYFRLVQRDVDRVSARYKSIQSSQASLEATQTGYEVGTRNIVEVLQKQQQLYQAIFAYATSRYTYILNGLRLKQTVGSLSAEDLQQLNKFIDPDDTVTKITSASGRSAN